MSFRLTFAAALCALAIPAGACSVRPGYRIPTTLELVEQADAIVLARVEDGAAADADADVGAGLALALAPVLALKGELPRRLSMPGWLEAGEARATRSDPHELVEANPDALAGACNRYLFARGMTLLLFLRRDGADWQVINAPFARTAEDVPSMDARWVRAVREYVGIAMLPPAARHARLAARRDALRARADADALAIAADMDRVLAGPRKPLREPLPPAP